MNNHFSQPAKESSKTAIMDSSSAIILYKSGMFDDTINFYRVVMSRTVYMELTQDDYPGAAEFRKYQENNRIFIEDLCGHATISEELPAPLADLDAGERDTIILYMKNRGNLIIIDDGRGAWFCKKMNIPYINALLVPRILNISGMIEREDCEKAMDRIISNGRYTSNIIEFARTCPDERLSDFI